MMILHDVCTLVNAQGKVHGSKCLAGPVRHTAAIQAVQAASERRTAGPGQLDVEGLPEVSGLLLPGLLPLTMHSPAGQGQAEGLPFFLGVPWGVQAGEYRMSRSRFTVFRDRIGWRPGPRPRVHVIVTPEHPFRVGVGDRQERLRPLG